MHPQTQEHGQLSEIAHAVVQRLCQVWRLCLVQPSEADPAVLGHIYPPFAGHIFHLRWGASCEGEHPNLTGDKAPILVWVQFDQLVVENLPDGLDAPRHGLHFPSPFVEQSLVADHLSNNSGPMYWWVAPYSPETARAHH